jgi:hypothetical protein
MKMVLHIKGVYAGEEKMVVTINYEFPKQRLSDLLITAFEGGVGYWCQIVDYKEPTVLNSFNDTDGTIYRYGDFPLSEDGGVVLQETDDTEITFTLNKEALLKGLQMMSQKYPKHFSDWLNDNEDAETGDVFVQCCMFGEVKYG